MSFQARSQPAEAASCEIHFTLGPACDDEATLAAIVEAGATACRVNMSHVGGDKLREGFARVRKIARQVGRPVRLGADLRGRKLRIGGLPDGHVTLAPGQRFEFVAVGTDAELAGATDWTSVNCPCLAEIAQPEDVVLVDDGALRLRIDAIGDDRLTCTVEVGGPLPERSGFNLPGRRMDLPAITAKDEADLDALASLRPDFVYLSYVETPDDLHQLKSAMALRGLDVPVVAKIERAVALTAIRPIARKADALCLARGDLGVEVDLPRLPFVQRDVVAAAADASTPVLMAGVVLYSLVTRHVPARAELTDVVAAIEQRCVGFVLSDETAVGCDPAGAVRWLRRIAEHARRTTAEAEC